MAQRPRKIKSAEELAIKIDRFFDFCEESGKTPSLAAMRLFLDVSADTVERWEKNDKGTYVGYAEVLKKAADRRQAWLIDRAFKGGCYTTAAVFMLKQPQNGGFSDRCDNQQANVNIKVIATDSKGRKGGGGFFD